MNPLAGDLDHVLTRTATDVWDALRGQQIFVTGGTGFFGRWLLESFAWANARLDLGARCVVLSRDPEKFLRVAPHLSEAAGLLWVVGDVKNFTAADIATQLRGRVSAQFPFLIHAATDSTTTRIGELSSTTFETCVLGMRNVLEFAIVTGTRRLLFTSSGAIYGLQPWALTHMAESFAGGPDAHSGRSAYAKGKRTAEHLCAQWHLRHPTLEPVIARCFAFAGPHLPLDAHFAVGNFIRDALRGGPVRVAGDGTSVRSYLYAADLAIWLWTMLVRAPALRPMNVGSEDAMSISEIARAVARIAGSDLKVEIAGELVPGQAPNRYVPDPSFARGEMGLESWIAFEEQIRRMLAWSRRPGA